MSPRRTLLAVGTVGGAGAIATLVALAATAPATGGCYTHQCDQSNLTLGLDSDGGVVGWGYVVVTGNVATWYSGPFIPPDPPGDAQTWQPYAGNETITFMLPPDAGIPPNATVLTPGALVSADRDAQGNFVPGSGQLDEFSNVSPTSVTVYNDTCEPYYVLVSVSFLLPAAGAGPSDASDAGPPPDASDAATDAPAGD